MQCYVFVANDISCISITFHLNVRINNRIKSYSIYSIIFYHFFLNFKYNVPVKRLFFLLNAAFAVAILDLISHVHHPSFVAVLHKHLKDSTFSGSFWSIIIFTGNGILSVLITFVFSPFVSIP